MKTKLFILGMFVFGFATMSFAQTETGKTCKPLKQKKIEEGIKSGELTKNEVAHLRKEQASVAFTKRKAKSDGVVTRKERQRIQAKRANFHKEIYLKKKNDVTR